MSSRFRFVALLGACALIAGVLGADYASTRAGSSGQTASPQALRTEPWRATTRLNPTRSAATVLGLPNGALTPRLTKLASTPGRSIQRADLGPPHGPGSLLRLSADTIVVKIAVADVSEATRSRLRNAGVQVLSVDRAHENIIGSVRPDALQRIGHLAGVQHVYEVLAPITMAGSTTGGGGRTNAASVPCNPIVSEGDTQLHAAQARSAYSVNGQGVTVGVLSDSFDKDTTAATHAAGDVSNGELPGNGNPCGFTTPVNVVADYPAQQPPSLASDEGRAMSQIVHGLAPGASIAFATACCQQTDFANNIASLRASAGAHVIVDDIAYVDEPVYQDGLVSNAIAQVASQGVSYFTAAGNSNYAIGGQDVGSYEATAFRDMPPCYAGGYQGCHNFNPSGSPDSTYGMTIAPGETMSLMLQWAQPWDGVTTDLDLLLLDDANNLLTSSTLRNADPHVQEPFEFVFWTNPNSSSSQHVNVVVARFSGPGVRFKLIHTDQSQAITSVEYSTSTATDIFGPSVFGHSGTANAVSVAASRFNSSPTSVEPFSSRGPATHLFGPVRNDATPAAALGSPEVLIKPDVTASDCVSNTFFGGGPPYYFCGTSAAAPHGAAIAALEAQRDPNATPAGIVSALIRTAVDITPTGVDNASGAGLIDANAALGALSVTVNPTSLIFGTARLGNSVPKTLTLTNMGSTAVTFGTISVSGANTSEFSRGADACSGATVAANASCQVGVTFTPASTGSKSAVLTIPSSAPGSPQTVAMNGTGIQPAKFGVNPSSFDFGRQGVNSAGASRTITITNTGTVNFRLDLRIRGWNASNFQRVTDRCSGVTVVPGGRCTFSLRFVPSVLGRRYGALSIYGGAVGPHTVALSGTGT